MNARAHSQNKRKGNGRPDETRATAARPSTKRCAIYTRKSPSARGLDLAFTSLDAQREAAIDFGIFMAAIDPRIVGQPHQL